MHNTIIQKTACESGLNLGGLGCGGIELWPDGCFHALQFLNNRPWASNEAGHNYKINTGYAPPEPVLRPEDLFFLLRVQEEGKLPQLRFLMVGHGQSFFSMGHMSRTYKYAAVPTVEAIEYTAEYPFIRLKYVDSRLPVEVELQAWTPFIAHDALESSTPGALFDFTIVNKTEKPLDVSIVYAGTNYAGFNTEKFNHHHQAMELENGIVIQMAGGDHAQHPTTGSMSLFAQSSAQSQISSVSANPYLENLFLSIYQTGTLEGAIYPPHLQREEMHGSPETDSYNTDKGWICIKSTVDANGQAELRFGLSWYFPNHFDSKGHYVGKAYENRFADSAAVARHLLDNADDLKTRSRWLPERVLESTIEPRFALSILDQISVLTRASWYSKSGTFYQWEGLGCCCLNTVDVQHYASFALATLFPDLQRGVLDITVEGQKPNGHIPHGFPVVSRAEDIPEGEYKRWDVNCQYILSLFREWKWSGDSAWLSNHWDAAKKSFELLGKMDRYNVGLPYIEGGITYDHWHMKGIVTYMAGLYLVTCSAMAKIADYKNEPELAAWARAGMQRGTQSFEDLLWSGEYYALFHRRHTEGESNDVMVLERGQIAGDLNDYNPEENESCGVGCGCVPASEIEQIELNDGLQTDVLNGEAYAALVGLDRVLDSSRIKQTLQRIVKENIHPELPFLANGTRRDGGFPDEWPFSQWQNPWTGTEYFFAAQLLAEGMEEEALGIIGNVFDRLTSEGMRFNHIECNTYYARPLSIFATYKAWLGVDCDVPHGLLRLVPNTKQARVVAPLLTATLLGEIEMNVADSTFQVDIQSVNGALTLRTLQVPLAFASTRCYIDGAEVEIKNEEFEGVTQIQFNEPVTLKNKMQLRLGL